MGGNDTRDEKVRLSDGAVAYEPTLRKFDGRPFSDGANIDRKLREFVERVHDTRYLRGLPRRHFVEKATSLFSELNTIHPFREGNGRVQRLFFECLAEQAKQYLDFAGITQYRMGLASDAAHRNSDSSMLMRMFEEITDSERSRLLREAG